MKVITGIYMFYFLLVLQETVNIACTLFFYHSAIEPEYLNWSLLLTGLYFSSAILYLFPSFYKSIVIGLSSQLYASIINILVVVLDGLRAEQVSHFHVQIVINMVIDVFKYGIGVALLAFVKQDSSYYYNLSM